MNRRDSSRAASASAAAWPVALRPVTQVAGILGTPNALMAGVRMYAVQVLHLLHPEAAAPAARSSAAALATLQINVRLHVVKADDVSGIIDVVAEVLNREPGNAVVNLSGGWEAYCLGALAAAYLTGSPAFAVMEDKVVQVPVLRVRYPDVLSPAKFMILRTLATEQVQAPLLKDLAAATGLTPSLVSYHLRGYRDRPGLEEMGLVESQETGARGHRVRLTSLGRNILAVRASQQVVRKHEHGGD